jgi:hypothetical protein
MGPGDSCAGWLDANGTAQAVDLSTKGHAVLMPEAQQDCVAEAGSLANGMLTVTFRRKLDTLVSARLRVPAARVAPSADASGGLRKCCPASSVAEASLSPLPGRSTSLWLRQCPSLQDKADRPIRGGSMNLIYCWSDELPVVQSDVPGDVFLPEHLPGNWGAAPVDFFAQVRVRQVGWHVCLAGFGASAFRCAVSP